MHESRNRQSNNKHYNSLSHLLQNDFCVKQLSKTQCQSKQSTREQFYQQVFKHKTYLRRQNHNLKRQIQQTKQAILTRALGIYFAQLKQLSQNNQKLRQKHRKIYEAKKPSLMIQPPTQRQPLQTPKSRRNLAGILNLQNNMSRPNLKINNNSMNNIVVGRKSLNFSNIQNQRPPMSGRQSLKLLQIPRRHYNNEQLTERKSTNSVYNSQRNFNNISTFSQTNSMRMSLKSQNNEQTNKSQNIFLKFIDTMLEQEKMQEKQIINITHQQRNFHRNHQEIYVNNLQKEIEKTNNNIQKLQNLLSHYEIEIKKMQINIGSVTDMTKQLSKVKQNYLMMQQKCKNVDILRVQVITKQRRLKQLKEKSKLQAFTPPQSIQMMLRMFGVEEQSLADPVKCKQEIKNIVRGNFDKSSKKKIKLKQLLDTIRQGRKKFKQLISVYQGRIKKLERKLVCFRIQQNRITEQ